jgi:tetratricopeptide (TPR) repeat protein
MAAVELPHLDNVDILVNNLGDFFFYQNRFEEAIQSYLRLDSKDLAQSFGIVLAYANLKKYDEAFAYCRWFVRQEMPLTAFSYLMLIDVYRKIGSYGEAINVYKRVRKTFSEEIDRKLLAKVIAWTYADMGEYNSAINYYLQASDTTMFDYRPSVSDLRALADVYFDVGLEEVAVDACHRSISLKSRNEIAYDSLGCICRVCGRWEEAANSLQRAIEINPGYDAPRRNIGVLYLLQEDLDRAELALKAAFQINPYNGLTYFSLGILEAMRGELEKARVSWQTGLDRYGEHAQDKRLFRSVYTVALGEVEPGLATLRSILSQEKPPRGLLQRVLETARLLHRCPGPIDGSEDVIPLLDEGLRQAPVFNLNP